MLTKAPSLNQTDGSLIRERRAIERLQYSDHVVKIHDIVLPQNIEHNGLPLKYYKNGELFSFMATRGALNERLAKGLFKQCLLALDSIHSNGVVHRDIKPENIFVDENFDLYFGDFGFAELDSEDNWIVGSQMVKGTTDYAAPEVLRLCIFGSYDGTKADLWSLGCILFQMLSGLSPFGERGAIDSDWHFKQIMRNSMTKFWAAHERFAPSAFSEGAKSFLESIFVADSALRSSAADLLLHPWLNDDPVSRDEKIAMMEEIAVEKLRAEAC